MRSVYVDTSAYLCLLLGEDGAGEVTAAVAGARLHSSVLLVLEARRNLVRLARAGHVSPNRLNELIVRLADDMRAFTLRDLTLDLCDEPTLPAVTTPRSLDLAHLRTALWFHRRSGLDAYVTRDDGQQQAARELGLPVPVGG